MSTLDIFQPVQSLFLPLRCGSDLTLEICDFIRNLARSIQESEDTLMVCDIVSLRLESLFQSGDVEAGEYYGPEIRVQQRGAAYDHWWLRLDDGTIVDATANQFGDDDPLRIIGPFDARQIWYLNEAPDNPEICRFDPSRSIERAQSAA